MVTRRQHDALKFISAFQTKNGYCPSGSEIATGMGLKARSGVVRILVELERRGFIRRLRGKKRAIEVIRMPEVVA